jgi:uncharacterized membrane protein YdfJ with MMPL/SSD domain
LVALPSPSLVQACFHTIADKQIAWLIPVMSFSTLTGLALDYDIFIISRIAEFRELGYDDSSAITLGLAKTGWIISAAGLVLRQHDANLPDFYDNI